ncbi:hypothetical protein [Terracidiphilus sp.]|jgi:hypothetical protein|uniref:hypothetical protein n=1 Tax=Terracidiphilus sp. TaxID=1964191 RepID=UPI003C25DA7E
MNIIEFHKVELDTILAALRLFRSTTDIENLPREQGKELATMIAMQITTSETGEPLMLLKPAQIDDLIDRLKSVTEG